MNSDRTLPPQPRMLAVLWYGWIGAPVWWLTQFQARYSLVPWAGRHEKYWIVPSIGCVAFVGSVSLALWAWKVTRRSTGEQPSTFLAQCGAWIATLFALLVFAQVLPDLLLDPRRL